MYFQLQEDYFKIIQNLISKPDTNSELLNTCKTVFVDTWSENAKKIVKFCLSSRIPEVDAFMKANNKLVELGNSLYLI